MMMRFRVFVLLGLSMVLAFTILSNPARAQEREVPYWATLRYEQVNMRVGPSREYPVEWVYKRKGLPVKVLRLREGWRLVQDAQGEQGWVAASQLTPERGILIVGQGLADMRAGPDPAASLRWRAEPGVVARFKRCLDGWCEIDATGRTGWVQADRLWGTEALPGSP
jgi:SH3-like domain-containing protein